MKYSICVIDDGIISCLSRKSIDDRDLINSALIRHLIGDEDDWNGEPSLRSFFRMLLDQPNDGNSESFWKVYALTHPNLYLDFFENDHLRFDILVLDWDFTIPIDHVEIIKEILAKSHCLIYIFSGADKIEEITETITNTFQSLIDKRIKIYNKHNDDTDISQSSQKLLQDIQKLHNENFSFKFGSKLRMITNLALDRILLNLSELHIEKTLKFLGNSIGDTPDFDLRQMIGEKIKTGLRENQQLSDFLVEQGLDYQKTESLIELIAEKIKNDLIDNDFGNAQQSNSQPTEAEEVINPGALEELWSYRLYYKSSDGFVRKGDIVSKDENLDVLFLVITPDCDLNRFWKKNLGYINLVPLYSVSDKKEYLKEKSTQTRKIANLKNTNAPSSFTNAIEIGGGALYFPFVKVNTDGQNKYIDYIGYPKEIQSFKIDAPLSTNLGDEPLLYTNWQDHQRVSSLGEPFLTPVIEHIMSTITGYGTPNYPKEVKDIIQPTIKSIFQ